MNEKREKNNSHPEFTQPDNPDTKVWRYIDLPKLIFLLDKGTLFFPRADILKDPHEGSVTSMGKNLLVSFWKQYGLDDIDEEMSKIHMKARHCTYISCWHMNEFESEAMWKLYCPNNQGVALQTTYRKLKESFQK